MATINLLNTKNYNGFQDVEIVFGGKSFQSTKQLTEIAITEQFEKELLYGNSFKPIGQGLGNYKYDGSIKCYEEFLIYLTSIQKQVDSIFLTAPISVLDILPFNIVVTKGASRSQVSTIITETLTNVSFLDNVYTTSKGGKMIERTLKIIFEDYKITTNS